jgi:hypothetical protein
MTTHGAMPSLILALAMFTNGAVAVADSAAAKTSSQTNSTIKLAPGPKTAKTASAADPFEDAPAPSKQAPAAVTPPKPAVAPATAPAQNLPSKELEAFMKGIEGSWKCDTKFAAGSMGPGSQSLNARTDMSIKKEFGGFSWHGEFKLAKTTTTAATNGMFQIGYAAGVKQATFLGYDSVGTAMMGAGSLAGDSVTFAEEGFLKGAKVRARETLTAKGPRKLLHKVEIDQGNGYQAMAEDTCSK